MKTALNVRELYCPSHFGNTYEMAGRREMTDVLTEAKFWGFDKYSDWFDTIDLYDVYHKGHDEFNMPEAVWSRKFANFQCAAAAGMELGLCVTPNHVFSNQVTPENAATKGNMIAGQLVCPSKPGVIDMVLDNYRHVFKDCSDRGLQLRRISGGAYDYGGCACEACRPWIVTFGKLMRRIVELARQFFGQVDADLWGWWWSDEDHEVFSAWADREAPGFFHSVAFHLPYGERQYKVRAIPAKATERAFVHIGYGDAQSRDKYGHWGPPIAAKRLPATVEYLRSRSAEGFMAYSEGWYDEINKAILAGLSSGAFSSVDQILETYAARHLGADAGGWRDWLHEMSDPFAVDVVKARSLFDRLSRTAREGWRLDMLRERLNLCEADAAVRSCTEWTAGRLEAARAFWEAKERLYRKVYGIGLVRAIFRFDAYAPDWQTEYAAMTRQAGSAPLTPSTPSSAG